MLRAEAGEEGGSFLLLVRAGELSSLSAGLLFLCGLICFSLHSPRFCVWKRHQVLPPARNNPPDPPCPSPHPPAPRHCRQEWHSPGWRKPLSGDHDLCHQLLNSHPHQQVLLYPQKHRSSAPLRHRCKRCSASALAPQGQAEPRGGAGGVPQSAPVGPSPGAAAA